MWCCCTQTEVVTSYTSISQNLGTVFFELPKVHVGCPILWKLRLIFKFRCGRDPAEVHAEKKQRGGGSVNKPRFVLQHF